MPKHSMRRIASALALCATLLGPVMLSGTSAALTVVGRSKGTIAAGGLISRTLMPARGVAKLSIDEEAGTATLTTVNVQRLVGKSRMTSTGQITGKSIGADGETAYSVEMGGASYRDAIQAEKDTQFRGLARQKDLPAKTIRVTTAKASGIYTVGPSGFRIRQTEDFRIQIQGSPTSKPIVSTWSASYVPTKR